MRMKNMEITIDCRDFEVSFNVEKVESDECYPGELPGEYVVDLKVYKIVKHEIKGGPTYKKVETDLNRRLNNDA